jgi:hypothetical protein
VSTQFNYLFISIYSRLFQKRSQQLLTRQPVVKREMTVYRRFMDMLLVEAVSDFPATTENDENIWSTFGKESKYSPACVN